LMKQEMAIGVITAPESPLRVASRAGIGPRNVGYATKARHLVPLLKASGAEINASAETPALEQAVVLVVAR